MIPLLRQRAELIDTFGDDHPAVAKATARIEEMKDLIKRPETIELVERAMQIVDEETSSIIAQLVVKVADLEQRIVDLETAPAKVQTQSQ